MDAAFPMKSRQAPAKANPLAPSPGERSFDRSVEIGLRRVNWIRITIAPDSVRYEAVGIGHRRLVVRCIPGPTAIALLASGVPLVVHRTDTGASGGR